jgi:hypothetical protein
MEEMEQMKKIDKNFRPWPSTLSKVKMDSNAA